MFWRDLILDEDVTLVVNLCRSVGTKWQHESYSYWPTTSTDKTLKVDDDISITLTSSKEIVSDHLSEYSLTATYTPEDKNEKIQKDIRVVHYYGWPDLEVPRTESEFEAYLETVTILLRHYL